MPRHEISNLVHLTGDTINTGGDRTHTVLTVPASERWMLKVGNYQLVIGSFGGTPTFSGFLRITDNAGANPINIQDLFTSVSESTTQKGTLTIENIVLEAGQKLEIFVDVSGPDSGPTTLDVSISGVKFFEI